MSKRTHKQRLKKKSPPMDDMDRSSFLGSGDNDWYTDILATPRPTRPRVNSPIAISGGSSTMEDPVVATSFTQERAKTVARKARDIFKPNTKLAAANNSAAEKYIQQSVQSVSLSATQDLHANLKASSSCNFMLEDSLVISLFSKKTSLTYSSQVQVKSNEGKLGFAANREMVLNGGKLRFHKSKSDSPVLEVALFNVQSIKYSGQDSKVFGITAFKTEAKSTLNAVHHQQKVTKFAIQCRSADEAKRWLQFILLEIEMFADVSLHLLNNMVKLMKVDSIKALQVPHVGCLLRKRVMLYEVAKLEDSTKLNEAKYLLADYLYKRESPREAMALFQQVDKYFQRKGERKKESLQDAIANSVVTDGLSLLKQELKLLTLSHR